MTLKLRYIKLDEFLSLLNDIIIDSIPCYDEAEYTKYSKDKITWNICMNKIDDNKELFLGTDISIDDIIGDECGDYSDDLNNMVENITSIRKKIVSYI